MLRTAHRLLGLALLLAAGCGDTHRSDDRDSSAGSDAGASPCGAPSLPATDGMADAGACCRDGVFEIHAPDRVHALRIEGCGAEWHCEVDGEQRSCGIGHGTLLLRLTDEVDSPGLQLSILDCIGDATIGYYDDANASNLEVPVCRVSD